MKPFLDYLQIEPIENVNDSGIMLPKDEPSDLYKVIKTGDDVDCSIFDGDTVILRHNPTTLENTSKGIFIKSDDVVAVIHG
jgi:hypothetical protein